MGEEYCKVIIIDDEFIMRQGMKHMLDWEKEGFQIVGEAANGQEGLELMKKVKPDIVIVDIVMPVMDGIEFSSIVQQKYPMTQVIIMSSFDRFEYVKTALMNGVADYVLKSTLNPEMLLKTLEKVVKKAPGLHITKREGQESPSAQIERMLFGGQEHLDEYSLIKIFPHGLFRIVGINLNLICSGRKDRMMWAEEKIVTFFESKTEYVSIPVFMEEEILCLILNYRMKDGEKVMADIAVCAEKIAEVQDETFFVASSEFSSLHKIKQHYQKEIAPYLNQRFYYPEQHLLRAEAEIGIEKEERFAFEKYTNYMIHGEFDTALAMYIEYIHYMCRIHTDENKMKNLTKNLLYNYLIEAENRGVSCKELKTRYFQILDRAWDVDIFLARIDMLEKELVKMNAEELHTEDEKTMPIKRYINEHYAEGLSLTTLAEKFGFSYHYLSFFFNSTSKEGFKEYLNKVRIEKACELLTDSNNSISEISSMTGYSDHTYFCKIFKRTTGETPTHFRRAHRA